MINNKNDLIRELLKNMDQISQQMRDIIYLNYFDKLGNENKYLLSMMADAFQTAKILCYALQDVAVIQSGLLLRHFLEQVAISYILVKHHDLLPKYVEHYKLRNELKNHSSKEKIKIISEKFSVPPRCSLAYLDYGWTGLSANASDETNMLKFAEFADILIWKKKYLDKMAHSSFVSTGLVGPDNDYPILTNFMEIAAKLFDYLCVAFHNLTYFDFVFGGEKLFDKFRDSYNKFYFSLYPNLA